MFFDRDGTLIHEAHYCAKPSQVRVFDGVPEALVKLSDAGFVLVIVTNQSGIGRGYFTLEDYHRVHEEVLGQLRPAEITAAYHDESTPDAPSSRRKPSGAMLEEAAREHGLDLSRSWMVTKPPTSSAAERPGCARYWSRPGTAKTTWLAVPTPSRPAWSVLWTSS